MFEGNYFINDNKLLEKLLAQFPASDALLIGGQKRVKTRSSRGQYMKNNVLRISFATVAFLIIAAGQNALHAQAKTDAAASFQSANRLVGAWETTVTPRNCTTGEQVAPSFYGVITFNEGGTVAEYGANPATPYRTPGHGVWASNGGGSDYSMKFSFLPLTPAGVPVGRMRITQDLELNRFSDEGMSRGAFVLTNFSGVVLASGCTTSTSVRVTL